MAGQVFLMKINPLRFSDTYICATKLCHFWPDNGLSIIWPQTITRTNADLSIIVLSGTYLNVLKKISFKEMRLEMFFNYIIMATDNGGHFVHTSLY